MKKRIKSILIPFVLLATLLLFAACADGAGHYDKLTQQGNSVSVRYDANGGQFDTGAFTIVDAYNAEALPKDSSGNYELALMDPNDPVRGSGNFHMATNNGYFLAGWYTERTEVGKDADGKPIYSYANKWDFANDTKTLDANAEYSAAEPVLTLYAAWVPSFAVNFYSADTQELVGSITYNPLDVAEKDLKAPQWNDSGSIDMYRFPKLQDKTFKAAYYDEAKTQPVTDSLVHTGVLNMETGTATDTTMNIYVDYEQGNWYKVYNMKQFTTYAGPKNSIHLYCDLDFGGGNWPSNLAAGVYTGTIEGNGHTISNVNVVQSDNTKTSVGLFGTLSDGAQLKDITFDNVTFTIKSGPRFPGTTYGLLAGTISADAKVENVTVTNSKLQVDAENFYAMTSDYRIGLICAEGYAGQVSYSGITYEVINNESATKKLEIKSVDDEENIIEIAVIG